MASNFTTGIPEIDRLTENKIGNGSFLLLSGNDDDGIAAFSAEIEKSNGRTADKETLEKNGCLFLKITPENRHCWKEICSRIFESGTGQKKQENGTGNELEIIFFADRLSELFQPGSRLKTDAVRCEPCRILSFMKEIKTDIDPQKKEPVSGKSHR